jgi:hypothetical protein
MKASFPVKVKKLTAPIILINIVQLNFTFGEKEIPGLVFVVLKRAFGCLHSTVD